MMVVLKRKGTPIPVCRVLFEMTKTSCDLGASRESTDAMDPA